MKKIVSENGNFVYYVNEKKGICICKCPTALESFEKEISGLLGINYRWDDSNFLNEISSKWLAKFGSSMNRIFGKAKANFEAGEVFDAEKGCEIARARLIEKLAAYRQGYYEDIMYALDEMRKKAGKRARGNNRIGVNAHLKRETLCQDQ